MRAIALLWMIELANLLGSPAQAGGDAPAIVIPGRAGVPVIINGGDASFCVVEGDWGWRGLVCSDRGGVPAAAADPQLRASLFPCVGSRPGYGRLEVEPPPDRELPKPAESYHRQWESQSAPVPRAG